MRRQDPDQQTQALAQLCALIDTILRPSPWPPGQQRRRVSPSDVALLLLGASTAMVVCGSVTFAIGFILMPSVIGIVMLFYFVGVVSALWRFWFGSSETPPRLPSPSPPAKANSGQFLSEVG